MQNHENLQNIYDDVGFKLPNLTQSNLSWNLAFTIEGYIIPAFGTFVKLQAISTSCISNLKNLDLFRKSRFIWKNLETKFINHYECLHHVP